jgi:hypothetical protein
MTLTSLTSFEPADVSKRKRIQWSCHGLVPVSFEQCLL